MVAQGGAVHGLGGRGDGFGELLPLIDDAINIQDDELGKAHDSYLGMKHGGRVEIVDPLARKTRPCIRRHKQGPGGRYICIFGSVFFERNEPFDAVGSTFFLTFIWAYRE
ncbi:hypothetical protein D3C81_1653650 [compost metagenome]